MRFGNCPDTGRVTTKVRKGLKFEEIQLYIANLHPGGQTMRTFIMLESLSQWTLICMINIEY